MRHRLTPREAQSFSMTKLPFKVLPMCSLVCRPAPAISLSTWYEAIFCSNHPHTFSHKGRGGIEHAESVYVAFGHLPLTSCTRLSCCDLSRLLRSASRSLSRFAATVMASAAAL